ncbi:NUDIX domain-containing protein [Parapedobacter indicus]|uniref:Predicted NTP pyrophosphohydrolase, NUDIX family n=1 Tax=Parapedobacter indicus TaxID=1477437 RepID=A0A1I3RY55_9SPHI|nr:NUDIX domain-containing protein [Parapedobacter indicus]PPK99944.1 putative NUDIX family NTP pyrophosphohydrolase [Parapedobacter indicus]SFJ50960.1 Predicted NTP pyrophosphohydrolase, NUDIX family [Parapedobacter indicus]
MKQSAGILLFRRIDRKPQFFLVHPGGPFFAKKDAGAWTIPKGEIIPPESPLDTAIREFEEETGRRPVGPFIPLDAIVQKGGKHVLCWAVEGDLDPEKVVSNTFELEWPPRSGTKVSFPEIDKSGWFTLAEAKQLINERQVSLLEQLVMFLNG